MQKECLVEDCDYQVRARGVCGMHYCRWYSGRMQIKGILEPMSRAECGRIGGSTTYGAPKGFAADRERARIAGTRGGRISRRRKNDETKN